MLFRSQEKVKKNELENWIEKRYASKSEEILKSSRIYMDKIEDNERKIKNFLNEFKFMTPDKRIFKKMYKIALSSQDKFINSLLLVTEKIYLLNKLELAFPFPSLLSWLFVIIFLFSLKPHV